MFLTLEDPRAKVQGSRDPLGVQPIWSRFGRHVVTNLTTVTTSVRGFTVLMLGRYYGQRLVQEGKAGEDEALPIFLRMEQLGAYARHVGNGVERDIRGIERVKRFLSEGGSKVTIQDDSSGMILFDQKTYGLWGLYTVSPRVSGLAADGPVGLTPEATLFVEDNYRPMLRRTEARLMQLLLRGGLFDTRRNSPLLKALANVLSEDFTSAEVAFYAEILRDGRHVESAANRDRQALFAQLLRDRSELGGCVDREEILAIASAAEQKDERLAMALRRIARLEALLASAEAIFGFLQARNDQRPSELANALKDRWGSRVPNFDDGSFLDLVSEIGQVTSAEFAATMSRCDGTLATGDFEEAILSLLDWNRLVMENRNAAPWIRLASGRLDVRYRGAEEQLPDAKELPTLWCNSYFIDSLRSITSQLEGAA